MRERKREREGRGSGRPGDSGSSVALAHWVGKARWAGERGRGPLGFGHFFYLFLNTDKKKTNHKYIKILYRHIMYQNVQQKKS